MVGANRNQESECGMAMGVNGNNMVFPRGIEGMIYTPRGNEVPILYNKYANPNTNIWDWGSNSC